MAKRYSGVLIKEREQSHKMTFSYEQYNLNDLTKKQAEERGLLKYWMEFQLEKFETLKQK